ncbi:hypothetical protein PR202_gb02543 [Eleusine coracana subsp. coracana]|uniref:S-acyltransferase n=1 Tax=Eleusine coracana subsp. coracana TaxID=191504 RepID=A0AAV5DX79_ELECO|nr:hypothetical protein PR202_gb02543 [Eleusine coracana subsp. coracana]
MYMPSLPGGAGGHGDAADGEQPRVYQEFLLQGRFIFGPDVRSIFLTMSLIVAPVVAFCVFVARPLINEFPDHCGISVMVVVVVFTIYDLTLLLLTSGRDPGIIPRNTHPPEPEAIDGTTDIGDAFITLAPFLSLTVSIFMQRNYRFFYMFVFSTTLLCMYVFAFCWVYVFKIRDAEHLSIGKAMLKTPASIALIGYCFLCVWFVGGLSVFHFYLMSTNQTTYENFRYRYDRRANPYNRGILNNFLEIFCTAIPPSKNNFRARVSVEQGLQQTRGQSRDFMSPNMGKPMGDLEMGRKPVAWDEPRTAADIRDLETGFGGMFDEKEVGRIAHASPDLSRDRDDLPAELMDGRAGMHSRQSSSVHGTGTSDSVDIVALQMAAFEGSIVGNAATRGTR